MDRCIVLPCNTPKDFFNLLIIRKMKIGIVQQSNTSDIEVNINKLKTNIRDLASQGADLVVLQELHNSLYFCQTENTDVFDLAESIPGKSTDQFGLLAKELGIVIVLSLFDKRAPGLYHNTAVVLEKDGSIAGKYRKMHIPDDPAYYEKFYFTPGDLGFQPIETSLVSWVFLFVGISGILKLHVLWLWPELIFLYIPQLSGGSQPIRMMKRPDKEMHGLFLSVGMLLQTDYT